MKIKKIILCVALLGASNAYAKCATLNYTSETCISNGGVLCADGNCYICCDPDNSTATTTCTGTYTTDTSLTFTDTKGSGYYKRYKYTKNCKCVDR